jgi:hypothetical protein
MADEMTRRDLMKRTIWLPIAAAGAGVALSACGEEEGLTCTDTSGLSPAELTMRTQQQYSDESPHPDEKVCDNCRFWQPAPQPDTCGGCQVIKGPIHPKGYCKLWAARA